MAVPVLASGLSFLCSRLLFCLLGSSHRGACLEEIPFEGIALSPLPVLSLSRIRSRSFVPVAQVLFTARPFRVQILALRPHFLVPSFPSSVPTSSFSFLPSETPPVDGGVPDDRFPFHFFPYPLFFYKLGSILSFTFLPLGCTSVSMDPLRGQPALPQVKPDVGMLRHPPFLLPFSGGRSETHLLLF